MPFELFTDWVNDYRQCVSWPGARISYPPARYYQRALPCLAGVLPKHLTEMPTQKECSECALSPEASARNLVSGMNSVLRGLSFQGCSGLGKGSRSALGLGEPDSFLSSLGGVGESLHSWQLEDDGVRETRPLRWNRNWHYHVIQKPLRWQTCKARFVIWG